MSTSPTTSHGDEPSVGEQLFTNTLVMDRVYDWYEALHQERGKALPTGYLVVCIGGFESAAKARYARSPHDWLKQCKERGCPEGRLKQYQGYITTIILPDSSQPPTQAEISQLQQLYPTLRCLESQHFRRGGAETDGCQFQIALQTRGGLKSAAPYVLTLKVPHGLPTERLVNHDFGLVGPHPLYRLESLTINTGNKSEAMYFFARFGYKRLPRLPESEPMLAILKGLHHLRVLRGSDSDVVFRYIINAASNLQTLTINPGIISSACSMKTRRSEKRGVGGDGEGSMYIFPMVANYVNRVNPNLRRFSLEYDLGQLSYRYGSQYRDETDAEEDPLDRDASCDFYPVGFGTPRQGTVITIGGVRCSKVEILPLPIGQKPPDTACYPRDLLRYSTSRINFNDMPWERILRNVRDSLRK